MKHRRQWTAQELISGQHGKQEECESRGHDQAPHNCLAHDNSPARNLNSPCHFCFGPSRLFGCIDWHFHPVSMPLDAVPGLDPGHGNEWSTELCSTQWKKHDGR